MTELRLESVEIEGPFGPIQARLARPQGTAPFPAVLLLQEGLGVTQHLLQLAQRFAENGYLTLVPDLYSHEPLHKQLREQEVLAGIPIARATERAARLAALPVEEQSSVERVIAWFDARGSPASATWPLYSGFSRSAQSAGAFGTRSLFTRKDITP